MKSILYMTLGGLFILISGCATQKVTRVSEDTTTDLSGLWNDTDARLVSMEMIKNVVSSPWLDTYRNNHKGDDPVVIVGNVRNESMEHIDTEVFTKELERELINSGEVRFVASPEEREQIRQEREDQQTYASYESMKKLARELGADYMLIGNLNSIRDESLTGKTYTMYYTTNLELIDIETNEKVWIGNKKIKKLVKRGIFRQ
ncbi:MAG TPA: penicillin-binding protein activator LpoB [Balneolales bacterium]|nr:penicillin-binding protein activator LpoB [Balneolales bacterium]